MAPEPEGDDRPALLLERGTELLQARQWQACINLMASPYAQPAIVVAGAGTVSGQAEPAVQQSVSGRTEKGAEEGEGSATVDKQLHGGRASTTTAIMQLLAIANVQLHAASGDWRAVLRLPPADSGRAVNGLPVADDVAAVQRQYRRLAVLVHPDKCHLPHAAEAFGLLGRAQERLLMGGGDPRQGTKRGPPSPRDGDNGGGDSTAGTRRRYGDDFDGSTAGCFDVEAEEGYEWWGTWDSMPAASRFRSPWNSDRRDASAANRGRASSGGASADRPEEEAAASERLESARLWAMPLQVRARVRRCSTLPWSYSVTPLSDLIGRSGLFRYVLPAR